MSAPLRVLAIILVSWAGFRAVMLGIVPGADLFTLSAQAAQPVRPQPAALPPLEPPVPFGQAIPAAAPMHPYPQSYRPVAVPIYYAVPRPAYHAPPPQYVSQPQPLYYPALAQPNDWALSRFTSTPLAPATSASLPTQTVSPTFAQPRVDRLQLSAWALVRGRQGVTIAPGSLAPGGTLGGSQAGARLTYVITPQIAASLRTTTPVGGASGGEVAAGLRFTPFASVPFSLTAERRKAVGRYGGGRDAFALFVEGGVYQQPLWGMQLDGYAQAGIVGAQSRDLFADGGFTLTRPLFRDFSGGVGVWGGVQPGLYRIDAGPRLSMKVRDRIRVHVDWRQRVAGNALPRSGPAVTLAGDF